VPEPGNRLLAVLAALALLCETALADDQNQAADPAADADLLEFLGSVDSGADSQATADDGSWIDYLAQTDIVKVAKKGDPNGKASNGPADQNSAPKNQATGDQPPASGDKKDE
jgi:hypothetical protein